MLRLKKHGLNKWFPLPANVKGFRGHYAGQVAPLPEKKWEKIL